MPADSSMHRFLTSPFDSHDLHLHMSSTMSAPSTQALGATPAIGDTNELKHRANGGSVVTPHHHHADVITPTTTEHASIGVPQELLMQQPGPGSEYSMSSEDTEPPDLFASQASIPTSLPPPSDGGEYSDDSDNDNQQAIAEAIRGALDELELTSSSIYTEDGQEDNDDTNLLPPPLALSGSPPPHAGTSMPNTTPQQNVTTAPNTKSLFSASPVTKESGLLHPRTLTAAGIPLFSSPISNDRVDTSLGLDLSLGADREKERGSGEGAGGDETLIGDEVEPSVMREADEFSRFDPSHLSSLLERESFNVTSPKSLPPLQKSTKNETKSTTSSLLVQRKESEVGNKEVSTSERVELMEEDKSEEGDVSSRTESALSYTASEGGSPTHTMEVLQPTSMVCIRLLLVTQDGGNAILNIVLIFTVY